MLTVKTPEQADELLRRAFPPCPQPENVPLNDAPGRILCGGIVSREYVPGFDRSSVDGYAVRSADTFGCSDAIPALLTLSGEIRMGTGAGASLSPGCCVAVPTGGAVPPGADAVVMCEYTESYGDGTLAVTKPAAPGENMVYRGDDVSPGQPLLPAGHRLTPQDIGALAALGVTQVSVCRRPLVGILSTGDELVPPEVCPENGQVRDVNTPMLRALCLEAGAQVRTFGIIPDDEAALTAAVKEAAEQCDLVLLSGGSSVGEKDAACRVIGALGSVLFHGIAMKPGKPTIAGSIGGRPVFGLPGHPVAAFFVARLFVLPLIARLMGHAPRRIALSAVLTESVSANHGRAQYTGVSLERRDGVLCAVPIRSKSGLITALTGADGYLCIPRDTEGFPAGAPVEIISFTPD